MDFERTSFNTAMGEFQRTGRIADSRGGVKDGLSGIAT